jgi:hypothetical protein
MRLTAFDDLAESAVLTTKDIADRLRIDSRSVRRAIARGELVASRTCGSARARCGRRRVVARAAGGASGGGRVARVASPADRFPPESMRWRLGRTETFPMDRHEELAVTYTRDGLHLQVRDATSGPDPAQPPLPGF